MSAMTPLEHILEVVFALKTDSSLHHALKSNAFLNPEDFLMDKEDVFDDLKYPDDKQKKISLEKRYALLLKIFQQFAVFQSTKGIIINDDA